MKHLGLKEFIILNLVMVGLVSRLWYVHILHSVSSLSNTSFLLEFTQFRFTLLPWDLKVQPSLSSHDS